MNELEKLRAEVKILKAELVPAWIFTVQESLGGNPLQELSYVINAYDGSVIGEAYQGLAALEVLSVTELQCFRKNKINFKPDT